MKAGGARRDRTADLLHAMQALSQLSYGPTWRRGTLPDRAHFVKKMKGLCNPKSPGSGQAGQGLCLSENGQRRIDGGRYGAAANRYSNGLRKLAERAASRGGNAVDNFVNGRRRPIMQPIERLRRLRQQLAGFGGQM